MCRQFNSPRHETGVSLIEMMVTVALTGVLMSLAAPSFKSMLSVNRIASATSEFTNALQLARAEAIRRGVPTTVRASSSGSEFASGFVLFPDADGNGSRLSVSSTTDGLALLERSAMTSVSIQRVTRTVTSGIASYSPATSSMADRMYVTFGSRGTHAVGPSYFRVCTPNLTSNSGRIVEVSAVGRVSVTTQTLSC